MDKVIHEHVRKIKNEFHKLRAKKNVQKYEKHVAPIINRLLSLGITAELVTTSSILMALLTAFLVIKKWLFLAGLSLAITGLFSFIDGIVARETKSTSKLEKFYSSLTDTVVDLIILFSLIICFYIDSYFMFLLTVFMLIIMMMNHHMLLLARFYKLKKLEITFYRPEFFGLVSVGLILQQLELFLTLSFLFACITFWKIIYHTRSELLPLFNESPTLNSYKKKVKKKA